MAPLCTFRISFFLVVFLATSSLKATHVIGGYLSYECVGNNHYELTLRVYRDCNPGNAPFNPDYTVTMTNGQFFQTRDLPKGPTVPVNTDTTDCVNPSGAICMEYADYIDTVHLPPDPGGYDLEAGFCCRNGLIQNIPSPLSSSTLFNTSIPPNDSSCNSSPTISAVPPVYLCMGEPIQFQLPVSESDGDSLHYQLCPIYEQTGSPLAFTPPF